MHATIVIELILGFINLPWAFQGKKLNIVAVIVCFGVALLYAL